MRAPRSINPEYIGKLITKQGDHSDNPRVKERLCILVNGYRNINRAATQEEREAIWPNLERANSELADLGEVV